MRKKRMALFVTTLIFTLSALLFSPIRTSAYEVGEVTLKFSPASHGGSVKGTFNYSASLTHNGGVERYIGEADYYYSDSYFSLPSGEYDPSLATMSFSLAMTAFTEFGKTPDDCYENAEKLLLEIGFSSFCTNAETDYISTPKTIGVAAAKKTVIDDGQAHSLVAIVLRGGGYGSEWASNFLVGSSDECSGNHKGFYDSRDRALEFITDYIRENAEGKTKLWICGFSRSAAVAGLVGAWFNDNTDAFSDDGITLSSDDIFTYTFEAPASVDRKNLLGKNYSNIFNLINKNDIIPKVPFTGREAYGWDFVRPGVDVPLIQITKENAEEINNILQSINPYAYYDVHNFSSSVGALGNTQSKFIEIFSDKLAQRVDRETYVEKIQGPIFEIMKNLMDRPEEELYLVAEDLLYGIGNDLGIGSRLSISDVVRLIGKLTASDTVIDSLLLTVGENLVRVGAIEEYDSEVREGLLTLVNALFKNDESGTNLTLYVVNFGANSTDRTVGDYIISENRIISAHMPETTLAHLMFSDPNFSGEALGYSNAPIEPKEIFNVDVNVLGRRESAAYYKGDEVRITALKSGCIWIDGFYLQDALHTLGSECSFISEEDITLDLKTEIHHENISEWAVECEPTEKEEGTKYKMCALCGTVTERGRIPALTKGDIPVERPETFPVAEVTAAVISSVVLFSLVLTLVFRYIPHKNIKKKDEND